MAVPVYAYKARIDHLLDKSVVDQLPEGLHDEWAKYACVLTSGLIELTVRSVFEEYTSKCANSNVTSYVGKYLDRESNLNMQRILDVVNRFSMPWSTELETITRGQLKDHIDSVISNRNLIVHGRSVGLTISQIRKYYLSAVQVLKLLDEKCETNQLP